MNHFLKLFRKIKNLGILFSADLIWKSPSQCDVLIYDQVGSEAIKLLFDARHKVDTLSVRGESLNIRILIDSLLRCLLPKRAICSSYIISYIKKVRPKLVITFIDNSHFFYLISKEVAGIKTAFVQNATRGWAGDVFENITPDSSYHVDFMFVFGADIGRQYSKFIEGESVRIGSIKNNMFQPAKTSNFKNAKRLAFISQWRPKPMDDFFIRTTDYQITHEAFYSSESLVLRFLSEWCQDNGYEFSIIGCARGKINADQEHSFYNSLVGSEYSFLMPVERLDSYHELDRFDLITYIDSTLGYESLARGKKAAAFTIRGSLLGIDGSHFGWPGRYEDTGPFWTNRAESAEFKKILDYLRDVSDVEWDSVRSAVMKNIMLYDADNKIIKEYLYQIVEDRK